MMGNYNRNYQQQRPNFNQMQANPPKPKKEQKRLSISFKEKEEWIYEELLKFSCPSGWIKDLIKEKLISDGKGKGC